MIRGKASVPVYVYLKKRKKVAKTIEFKPNEILFDLDKNNNIIGFEFLDCVGITVEGKSLK